MTIKVGRIRQIKIFPDTVSETRIGTVVEKTQGNYIEVLFWLEDIVLNDNGTVIDAGGNISFDTYVGKTIDEVLALYDITNYEWLTPLTEM